MAIDPFSGASKPLPPASILESRHALPFAATLNPPFPFPSRVEGGPGDSGLLPPLDVAGLGVGAGSTLGSRARAFKRSATQGEAGKARGDGAGRSEIESDFASLAMEFGAGSSAGFRFGSGGSGYGPAPLPLRSEDRPALGSDRWMEVRVAQLVDQAGDKLDLSGCGLTTLSPKIADLQHLVTFGSGRSGASVSPAPSTLARARHPSASPALRPDASLSPAPAYPPLPGDTTRLSPFAASARTFGRIASAPVVSPSSSAGSPLQRERERERERVPVASLHRMAHHRAMLGSGSGAGLGAGSGWGAGADGEAPSSRALGGSSPGAARAEREGRDGGSAAAPRGSPRRPRESLPFGAPDGSAWGRDGDGMAGGGPGGSSWALGFDPPGSPVPDPALAPAARASSSSSPYPTLGPGLAPPRGPGSPRTRPTRKFARTASGSMEPVARGSWAGRGSGQVELYLANNQLGVLPSALFQVTNLVLLSLRSNRLTELPAAIGTLKELRNLNVSMNRLKSFPPAILDLSLDEFLYASNTLLPCPPDVDANTYPSKRLLGPLTLHNPEFPTLRSLCLSQLLSPRRADGLPPLLSTVDWEPEAGSKEPHGLQDAAALHASQNHISMRECERITACLRTAVQAGRHSRRVRDGIPRAAFSPDARRSAAHTDKEAIAMGSDDAALNPYYTACPSPHHTDGCEADGSKVTRRIYLHAPAEERMEWVKIKGADSLVPIRWQGCQRGCLDFLEQPEVVQGEDEDKDDEDGFDAAVLEED